MPSRVGHVLLEYVKDVLSGRRVTDERLGDLAFAVRIEVGRTLTPEEAAPVLRALPAENPRRGPAGNRPPAPPRRR